MAFYAALAAMLVVGTTDASVLPRRAPIRGAQPDMGARIRRGTQNLAATASSLSKGGMDKKTLIILLA
ncbi:hypothetical protein FRB90_001632, partial [Tulasnella sp. 427]